MRKAKICKWLTIRDQFTSSNGVQPYGMNALVICDQVKHMEKKLELLSSEVHEINAKFNLFTEYQRTSSTETQNQLKKIFEILQNKNTND